MSNWMNRGYLRRQLRSSIGEPDPYDSFYTDNELNEWLNEAAYDMASKCQPEETIYQFTTAYARGSTSEYAREYEMPAGTDEIFGVTMWNGIEQKLTKKDEILAIRNNQITGVPTHFYIRKSRKQIETNASGITSYTTEGNTMRFFVGLDPKPSGEFVVSVFYYAAHFYMNTDLDVPVIPAEFRRGLIDYARIRAFEKDDMHALKNIAVADYNAQLAGLKDKMINKGQEVEFPRVRLREFDDDYGDDYYEVVRYS